MQARESDALWNRWRVGKNRGLLAARGSVSDYLLHIGLIVSTKSTSEWLVTSVLGLQR